MMSMNTRLFIRKRKFWIGLASVFVVSIMVLANLMKDTKSEYRTLYAFSINYKSDDSAEYIDGEVYLDKVDMLKIKLETSVQKKDWPTVNEALTDIYLLQAQKSQALYLKTTQSMYYHDYMKYHSLVQKLMKERNLPILTREMFDVEQYYDIQRSDETLMYPYYQFHARYYNALVKQNIQQLSYSTVDSSTILPQFIRSMFPLLPIILIVMLCYDSLQEDKDSGVLKVLLTQPRRRCVYIKDKIVVNIKASLFIFVCPLLVLSLSYGLFDHYKTFRAPVLVNVQGITSLHMMENTLAQIQKNNGNIGTIGITKYFSIPSNSMSPNVAFDFIEMWQFIVLCIVMMVLILVFIVLLTLLLDVLVQNKFITLVLAMVLLLVGMFFASPSTTGIVHALLPTTYMNPVNIITGYSSYTYLNGLLVLVASNVILYIAIIQLYKRKDALC